MMEPWRNKQVLENPSLEWPREGIGCWHPIFPGRIDDIWMMGSIVVRIIESTVMNLPEKPEVVVYESNYDKQNQFIGVNKVK